MMIKTSTGWSELAMPFAGMGFPSCSRKNVKQPAQQGIEGIMTDRQHIAEKQN
jgi:hypothetical protein